MDQIFKYPATDFRCCINCHFGSLAHSMELSLLPYHQHTPTLLPNSSTFFFFTGKRPSNRDLSLLPCRCSSPPAADTAKPAPLSLQHKGRRELMGCLLSAAAGMYICDVAGAVSTSRRALRGAKIPESEYTTLPSGLKYYDLKVGDGTEAVKGSRVAVHYVAKWKGITFMTSRQGLGVGGGTPYGFDVGQSERGSVLKGLDLGVQGMRVGGQRLLIVPPKLAYGSKGIQEIPPNATIELDVELLAIKESPFGSAAKIVEG
ncbi:peptidyl-prolyl cis-trans isomerase FKBP16-4, chloroplastic-like isoform X2 [Malania oleifera]|uniref:peptidyl-prolyl cis-trans isomerase FKBP16-4, chloroplastic-like isoform X2 n=1 Tax=Malania oleifera TaxID=397392 RepID=UPI0025ADCE08|nr:peptidyl-prolyl cis-trans isomerase FKBP16-4, chloroplastic-like isoform X2 [Malania oleifera]